MEEAERHSIWVSRRSLRESWIPFPWKGQAVSGKRKECPVAYPEKSEEIVGHKTKIRRKDTLNITGYTIILLLRQQATTRLAGRRAVALASHANGDLLQCATGFDSKPSK
jgi:hypothetical protein